MKKKIACVISILFIFAVVIAIPVMAAELENEFSTTPEVMHLTPENNPADPKLIEEINEDIENGDVVPAKLKSFTEQAKIKDSSFTKVRDFTFKGVSYTGLESKAFNITGNDVAIEARAWQSNGDPGTGDYTITLYRDGFFPKNLGTATYRYTPQKYTYYNIWFDVGPGTYQFVTKSPNTLIDGDGQVLQRL